jgi:hypothetical protein
MNTAAVKSSACSLHPSTAFLIDEFLPNRQEGRIHRGMLNKVWKWLGRDVMPTDVQLVLEQAGNAAVSGERVDGLVQALRTRSADAIGEALRRGEIDDREHRRMGIELGGERGISELRDIHKVFSSERWLMPFLEAMPDRINERRLNRITTFCAWSTSVPSGFRTICRWSLRLSSTVLTSPRPCVLLPDVWPEMMIRR